MEHGKKVVMVPLKPRLKNRNRKCGTCGSSRTDYRTTTHDLRCKDCKAITKCPEKRTFADIGGYDGR